ncbi:hypothetical protein WDW37_13575 [Bdellovibrionota bacterium FG-1]
METKNPIQRKFIRHVPDEGDFALIDLNPNNDDFKPTIPALIINEAYKGCGLLVHPHSKLAIGTHVRAQVGKLAPVLSEIRWRKDIDSEVCKIGLLFLE